MSVKQIIVNKSVTKLYKVKFQVRNIIYWLHFEIKDGKIPNYTEVSTQNGNYFNFSEVTRKRHFEEMIKSITP